MSSSPPPSVPLYSQAQIEVWLRSRVEQFVSENKGNGDADAEICRDMMSSFLYFAQVNPLTDDAALVKGSQDKPDSPASMSPSSPKRSDGQKKFSSIGRILSDRAPTIRIRRIQIAPMMSQTSTALSIFSSPKANQHIENLNKDLDFENEKVLQMDNVVQKYTDEEDAMITSGLGLIAGMEMKGAISFRDFKTTFSATKYLRGYYNSKDGDIYGMSSYTVRGDVSMVAARLTNYWADCYNPAFAASEETSREDRFYLEVPNSHSAIYCQAYNFPSPMTNREGIVNIVWKVSIGNVRLLVAPLIIVTNTPTLQSD
jgi:hypothetical protein